MWSFFFLGGFVDVLDEFGAFGRGEQRTHVEINGCFDDALVFVGFDEGLKGFFDLSGIKAASFVISLFPVLGNDVGEIVFPFEDIFANLLKSLVTDEPCLGVKLTPFNKEDTER